MAIPTVIHQTARTKTLSWEEGRLTRRLRRMHKGWTIHLWDDDDNARLIREHFPRYANRYDAIPFGVAKSDVARYAYLHAYGGFYLDTDYKLFRPINAALRGRECLIPLEGADPQVKPTPHWYLGLGNAFMGSEPGYHFWSRLIEHIFEDLKPHMLTRSEDIIPATGPEALTRFYIDHAAEFPEIALPEKNGFYPAMMWLGTRTSADGDTYGVHLHWGSWRKQTFNVALRNLIRRKLNGLLS